MRCIAVGVLAIVLSQQPLTKDDDLVLVHNGMMTGQEYLKLDAHERAMYMRGFVNGMSVAPLLGAPYGTWFDKCLTGRNDQQLAEIIRRFIDAHPERWHEGLNGLSYAGVTDSCKP